MTGDKIPSVSKGTPRRTVRIPDALWDEARELTKELGLDISTELRKHLERDVQRWRRQVQEKGEG